MTTSRRGPTAPHARHAAPQAAREPIDERPAGGPPRISPGLVIIGIALVLSVGYAAYAVTVRDASQIPLLASGAVVLGITFLALAIYCLAAIWRAGIARRNAKALLLGLVGGGSFTVAAGCFSAAYILFMLGTGGPT